MTTYKFILSVALVSMSLTMTAHAQLRRLSAAPTHQAASNARRNTMSPDARELFRNATCDWVEGATDNAQVRDRVAGYPMPGCTGTDGRDALVCSGTARCNVSIPAGGRETPFTLYVENVMCASSNSNRCPDARRCIQNGGVLADFAIENAPNANEDMVFSPKTHSVSPKNR